MHCSFKNSLHYFDQKVKILFLFPKGIWHSNMNSSYNYRPLRLFALSRSDVLFFFGTFWSYFALICSFIFHESWSVLSWYFMTLNQPNQCWLGHKLCLHIITILWLPYIVLNICIALVYFLYFCTINCPKVAYTIISIYLSNYS